MSYDIIDISDDSWSDYTPATKIFTDREDPQESFERKYNALYENWRKTFYVLNYYGIGGIGKTSFIDELCKMIRGVSDRKHLLPGFCIDCDYIRYDFGAEYAQNDKLSILLNWRKQLGKANKDFRFYRFDSAILLYCEKTEESYEQSDSNTPSILSKNPWLSLAVEAVGLVPEIGWVSNAIKLLDQSLTTIIDTGKYIDKKEYREHLKRIQNLEAHKIIEQLHEYFILDMRKNMMNVAKKPLVVFLDTYEKYIDTLNRDVSMITEDFWFRKGRRSVIQSIPGVLWVIMGREKLYWAQDDTIWGEEIVESPSKEMSEEEKNELAHRYLEQHLLGDLSLDDAKNFLKTAGITDDELCNEIYALTNGTPLFLDICVNTYHDELLPDNPSPTIEDFGSDLTELISRYLSNMNPENTELSHLLAYLGTWNDEMVIRIANESKLLRRFTHAKYKAFLNHSFIIKNQDGTYYMHETVRIASKKNIDQSLVTELTQIRLNIVKKALNDTSVPNLIQTVGEYVDILTTSKLDYPLFYEHLMALNVYLDKLEEHVSYDSLFSFTDKLLKHTQAHFPNTGACIIAQWKHANALQRKGFCRDAFELISGNQNLEDYSELPIKTHLEIAHFIASMYIRIGLYHKGMLLCQSVYDSNKNHLGADHPDTLKALNLLASAHYYLGNYKESFVLGKEVFELRGNTLGNEHPDTLTSKNNLALHYAALRDHENAFRLRREVLATRIEVLGDNHPDTLSTKMSLADSYTTYGNYQDALALKQEVLLMRTQLLGSNHPDVLSTEYSIASTYNSLGDYEKALALIQKVRDARISILGEDHPDTLSTIQLLAHVYDNVGEYMQALHLKENVYQLRSNTLGEYHPDTLSSLESIAESYNNMGRYEEALTLQQKVLVSLTKLYGENSPSSRYALHNLCIYYYKIGRVDNAIELQKTILTSETDSFGENHPRTLKSKNNLSVYYTKIKNYKEAIQLQEEITKSYTEQFGLEHPETLCAKSNLSITYHNAERYEEALALEKEVHTTSARVLGADHPDTLKYKNNLSVYYNATNQLSTAIKLQTEVLEARIRVLGEDHPDTIDSQNTLQHFYNLL